MVHPVAALAEASSVEAVPLTVRIVGGDTTAVVGGVLLPSP